MVSAGFMALLCCHVQAGEPAVFPVVDLHADILLRMWDKEVRPEKSKPLHGSVQRLKAGGTLLQGYPIFVSPKHQSPWGPVLRQAELFEGLVQRGEVRPWRPNCEQGRIDTGEGGAGTPLYGMLALEGAHVLEEDLSRLDVLVQKGLRMVGLVWTGGNAFGSGYGGKEPRVRGLTPLGKKLLERMQMLGLILDLAHTDEETFWDAITSYHGQVVVSHAAVRALYDSGRNLDDEQLVALASKCGLFGLFYHSRYIVGRRQATVEEWLKHARYVVSVAGPDVLALGSDFDGGISTILGVPHAGKVQVLLQAMLKSGWTPMQVLSVASGNALASLCKGLGLGLGEPSCRAPLRWRPAAAMPTESTFAPAFDRLSTTMVRVCQGAKSKAYIEFESREFIITHVAVRLRTAQPVETRVELIATPDGTVLAQGTCPGDGRRCLLPLKSPESPNGKRRLRLVLPGLAPGGCVDVLDVVPIFRS